MMAGRWSEGICNTNVGSGLVRWELSCDDSRPVGTHIISTKNGALGRQEAVVWEIAALNALIWPGV